MQKELEMKLREISEKDQKMQQIKQSADRSDRMLKKHMGENESLKKQIQNLNAGVAAAPAKTAGSRLEKPAQMPVKRDL